MYEIDDDEAAAAADGDDDEHILSFRFSVTLSRDIAISTYFRRAVLYSSLLSTLDTIDFLV